jgi:hypothetical protein
MAQNKHNDEAFDYDKIFQMSNHFYEKHVFSDFTNKLISITDSTRMQQHIVYSIVDEEYIVDFVINNLKHFNTLANKERSNKLLDLFIEDGLGDNMSKFIKTFKHLRHKFEQKILDFPLVKKMINVIDKKWMDDNLSYTNPDKKIIRKTVYSPNNKDQYFISLDLRQGNITSLFHLFPILMELSGLDDVIGSNDNAEIDCDSLDDLRWSHLVELFTDLKVFRESKQFRHIVMGTLAKMKTDHNVKLNTLGSED